MKIIINKMSDFLFILKTKFLIILFFSFIQNLICLEVYSPFFPFYNTNGSSLEIKISDNKSKRTKNIVLKYDSTKSLNEIIIKESNKKEQKHLCLTKIYSNGEANFVRVREAGLPSTILPFIKKWNKNGIGINDTKKFDSINKKYIDFKNNDFHKVGLGIPEVYFEQLYIVKDKNKQNDTLSILYISYSGQNQISRTIYTYSMIAKSISMDSIATIAIAHLNNERILSYGLPEDSFYYYKKNNLFNHFEWEFKSNLSTSLDFAILMPYIMYLDTQILTKVINKIKTQENNYFSLRYEYLNTTYKNEEVDYLKDNYFKYFKIYYLNNYTNIRERCNGWLFSNLKYKKEYLTSNDCIISDMTIKRKKNSLLITLNLNI